MINKGDFRGVKKHNCRFINAKFIKKIFTKKNVKVKKFVLRSVFSSYYLNLSCVYS
jgi:hypothetical protein